MALIKTEPCNRRKFSDINLNKLTFFVKEWIDWSGSILIETLYFTSLSFWLRLRPMLGVWSQIIDDCCTNVIIFDFWPFFFKRPSFISCVCMFFSNLFSRKLYYCAGSLSMTISRSSMQSITSLRQNFRISAIL